MTLAAAPIVAFVASTDLARSRAFYEGILGLPVIDEDEYACAFDAHGTMLRVTAVPELTPAPFTVLGWRVADLPAAIREMESRGVAFRRYERVTQDELGIWQAPGGAQVAWFTDPDGNTLSLAQFRG